jgi:hypothetical protein
MPVEHLGHEGPRASPALLHKREGSWAVRERGATVEKMAQRREKTCEWKKMRMEVREFLEVRQCQFFPYFV